MKNTKTILFSILLGVTMIACSKKSEAPVTGDSASGQPVASNIKVGSAEGVVKGVDQAKHTITLDHKTVPGIMDAMTMEYPLSDPALAGTVRVGDSVNFTMEDHGQGKYYITSLKIK